MPEPSSQHPDVTILMPCLNEANALPVCIEMAQEALELLQEKGYSGEVLISDNGSTDGSQQIAKEAGCRVVHCAERGYGAALINGCREARGRYIVMGDSDASYDFREGVAMVERLAEGYDLCMGNRFKGEIAPGAMPWKNRVFGNPALSGILNLFYRTGMGDAHSGLRGITREAFERLKLHAPGMEFASEMVVKATLLKLRRTEVPITLHPDKRGRAPHLNPWRDGWRHLRFLIFLSPFWAFMVPSILLIMISSFIFSSLLITPPGQTFQVGSMWFGDHWMILCGGLFGVGFSGLMLGVSSYLYSLRQGYRLVTPFARGLARMVTPDRIFLLGLVFCLMGVGIMGHILVTWGAHGFGGLAKIREMVVTTACFGTGLKMLFWGFMISLIVGDSEALLSQLGSDAEDVE